MNYLSVCSGIEAATKAWHPLGWTAEAFAEVGTNLSELNIQEQGFETVLKNLSSVLWDHEKQTVNMSKAYDDPRGNLMLTYLAIAARFKPRWLVWENVPGVLSSNGGRDFGTFLGGLAECGYGFAYRVLDAQYCRTLCFPRAVPQRRRRVFVVGHIGDWRRAAAVLFDRESLCGNPPPRREAGKKVAADAGSRASSSHWDGAGCHPSLAGANKGSGGIAASNQEIFSQRGAGLVMATGQAGAEVTEGHVPTLNCNHEAPIAFERRFVRTTGGQPQVGVNGCLRADTNTGDGAPCVAFAENSRAELRYCGGDGKVSSQLTTGGGKPGQGQPCVAFGGNVARTLNARHDSSPCADRGMDVVAQSMSVRRLTPVECERLQGFPDDFTRIPWRNKPADQCPGGPRYKALGNSMAVNCMEWIGRRINHIENFTHKRGKRPDEITQATPLHRQAPCDGRVRQCLSQRSG